MNHDIVIKRYRKLQFVISTRFFRPYKAEKALHHTTSRYFGYVYVTGRALTQELKKELSIRDGIKQILFKVNKPQSVEKTKFLQSFSFRLQLFENGTYFVSKLCRIGHLPVKRNRVRRGLGPIKFRLWRCASARLMTLRHRENEAGRPGMKQKEK